MRFAVSMYYLFLKIPAEASPKIAKSANRQKKNKVYNIIKAEVEEKAKRRPSKDVSVE